MAKSTVNINISGGGTDTSDATANASDITSGKTAYIASGKVTGTAVASLMGMTTSSIISSSIVLVEGLTMTTIGV